MAALMTSCGDKDVVTIITQDIADNGWSEQEILSFDCTKLSSGPLYIRIEHGESYGYENLYLKSTILRNADTLASDIFSIPLMTNQGQWLGDNTSNDFLRVDHLFPTQPLPSGATSLQVQQYSRSFLLKDIEQVSLLVKKH